MGMNCLSAGVGACGGTSNLTPMKAVLVVLVAVLMFATLGVLLAGMFGLARGADDPRRSNMLMRWRVILQACALLLFALLLSLLRP